MQNNGTIRRIDLKIRKANFEKFKPEWFKLDSRKSNPKDLHFDEVRMWPSLRLGHMSDCDAVSHISNKCQIEDISIENRNKSRTEGASFLSFMRNPFGISHIARRPVSALWTLNYTTDSSTEAMNSGNIANVKFAINQNSFCEFSFRYYWKVRALDGGGEQG